MKDLQSQVKTYIESIKDNYIDDCGEFDYTAISEDAADEFELFATNLTRDIPEWVYDMTVDVCNE